MHSAQSLALGRFDVFQAAASCKQLEAFFSILREKPLAGQAAYIVGKVEYCRDEGPLREIPQGIEEVRATSVDAVINWSDSIAHGLAAMPVANCCQYVADGAIIVANKSPMPT